MICEILLASLFFSADFGRAQADGPVKTMPDGVVARFTNETLTVDVPLGDRSGRLELPARLFPTRGVKTVELGFDGTWWRMTCEGRTDEDSVRTPLEVSAAFAHEPFDFPAERDERPFRMPGLRGWRPRAWNASVGDVACLAKDGVLHVFYLYDRRHHGSKGGAGGHWFAHLTTTNLVDWVEQPAAVPLREWWQTLGTGTPFVLKDGRLALAYGYHTERLPNAKGKPVGATYAVSDDGIHFRPTDEIIHTTRNPTIYNRPDGRYGLILGYQKDGGIYVSDDLRRWTPVDTTVPAHGDCPCYYPFVLPVAEREAKGAVEILSVVPRVTEAGYEATFRIWSNRPRRGYAALRPVNAFGCGSFLSKNVQLEAGTNTVTFAVKVPREKLTPKAYSLNAELHLKEGNYWCHHVFFPPFFFPAGD